MKFNMKKLFHEHDLCYVTGYGNSTWEILGVSYMQDTMLGKVTNEDIMYTVKHVFTGEEDIAFQEDITLVCRARYAYDYIRQLNKDGSPPKMPVNITGKEKVLMINVNESERNHVYPDTMNGLLDELFDLLSIVDEVGEDEYLKHKISDVKFRLLKYKK